MFHIYKKKRTGTVTKFTRVEKASNVSLFGRNEGWIPWILKRSLAGLQENSEPLFWHLSEDVITRELENDQDEPSGNALVIDLKPGQDRLSLYEVLEAWGYSSNGWTPFMLRLRGLFIDADPKELDKARFTRSDDQTMGPIFSFYYARGTIQAGEPKGSWNPPGRTSTNSVVLFPDAMRYFAEAAQKFLGGPPS